MAGRCTGLVLRHVSTRFDGNRAAGATIACADAVESTIALRGGHLSHASGDGDGVARSINTTTDAGSLISTSSRDSAARDGDGAARSPLTTTDAGSTGTASSRDVAALNFDVSTGYF